jgi:hypothetical protein
MKDNVMLAMLTGQPIKVAPLYNPMNGPSTQNVVNTAFQTEGEFLEGNFEKVIYMNPNGTKRKRPFLVGPEAPPEYKGPGFVPTVQNSLFGESITPAGGIIMPPQMLNGFELALRGLMDAQVKPISGEVRDEVYDAVINYRDERLAASKQRKMDHLMTQGYTAAEVEDAMAETRKQNLINQMSKPTPIAPVSIKSALETMVKRDYNRPAMDNNTPMMVG